MIDDSLLRKTGQAWKFYLGVFGFFAGDVMALVGGLGGSKTGAILVLAGVQLILGSTVFGLLSLRCPHCRIRWLLDWKAASRNLRGQLDALSVRRCPRCDYAGPAA